MNQLTELAASVEADVAKDNLKELIAEKADDVMESLTGITPGLSIVAKLAKIYHSVRDYFLMEKIVAFLTDLSSLKVSERKSLIGKLNDDPIYGQKFGKFIIIAIDRLEYIDKAIYLARACKFYERGDISKELFIKVKGIIEKVELAHLKRLGYEEENGYCGYPQRFNSEGLYLFQSLDLVVFEHTISDFKEYSQLKTFGMDRDVSQPKNPELTELGRILIHIIKDLSFGRWLKDSSIRHNTE
jgi:hypothetical protein